jgi:translocation and assembly module TamB
MIDGAFDVKANVSSDRQTTTVAVDVPALHVDLPAGTTRSVQPLGDIDNVRVGVSMPPAKNAAGGSGKTTTTTTTTTFVPIALDEPVKKTAPSGKALNVSVHLGDDVQVKSGSDLKVSLDGTPQVSFGGKMHVGGQIRLRDGTLNVQGKPFQIESGTVTFVGDDYTNPEVVVTASWTAPDDTHIYADFIGPLKTGKVTLRSEPALANSEILALILFGTTDAQSPTSALTQSDPSAVGQEGLGVAGGAASASVNRALGMLGAGGVVQTKVDTSAAGSPRPEVEVQIAKDLSLQFAVVLGLPPPTNPDHTLVSLDWRFLRSWSVETTVGDAGTSILDFIWSHRY